MICCDEGSVGLFEYEQDGAGFNYGVVARAGAAGGIYDMNDYIGRFFGADATYGPVAISVFTRPDQEVAGYLIGGSWPPWPFPTFSLEDSNYAPIWIWIPD